MALRRAVRIKPLNGKEGVDCSIFKWPTTWFPSRDSTTFRCVAKLIILRLSGIQRSQISRIRFDFDVIP